MRLDSEGFAVDRIPEKSAASLLQVISTKAWDGFPIKKTGLFADKLRRFFSQEELGEICTMTESDE
jgi:hypothetical protein